MRRSKGQAMTEFVVCAGVLVLALLVPLGAEGSVAERVLDALARFHRNHVFLIAMF